MKKFAESSVADPPPFQGGAGGGDRPADPALHDPLLVVERLSTHFPLRGHPFGRRRRAVRAVDDVSFTLRRGRTLGVVGESGCGKTTLARTILRLAPASAGRVVFNGQDVLRLRGAALRRLRRHLQIVFQDPLASLNPRLRVETIIGEALQVHGLVRSRRARRERVAEVLRQVGLPADSLTRYPHEFSGGQRQRIGIARALVLEPDVMICDEPVSALDVSIQSQIMNLLTDLQARRGLSFLLIAHDLAVVQHASHDIAVMYLGRIVEHAPTPLLFQRPAHPYTQALLAAVPRIEPAGDETRRTGGTPAGEPPSPIDPPPGCAYHPRCPFAEEICQRDTPPLTEHAALPAAHLVACHFAEKVALSVAATAADSDSG